MEKLGDVTIQNSLTLAVNCQVDQHLLAKNFTTILNALRDLQQAQQKTQSQLKDLSSFKDKFDQLVQKVEKAGLSNNKEGGNDNGLANDGLLKRVQKSQNNILDNIKDINLINKEITSLKDLISGLKNNVPHNNTEENDKNQKNGYVLSDVASNMSKELQLNADKMKQLELRLLKAEDQISKHQTEIKELFESRDKKVGKPQTPTANKNQNLQDLKKDLRQKLDIINKKINSLQSDSDSHEQEIAYLKDILAQKQENNNENQPNPIPPSHKEDGVSYKDLNDLKKKIEEVDKRENKDVKNLMEQINNLKQQLKAKAEKADSKSSFEDQSKLRIRKSSIQKDDLSDKVNDLIMRVTYLEKLQSSSRNIQDKNPEKLPAINRPKKKDPNQTSYQQKDKSLISRRDLGDLKAQLQAWIKNLFDENRDRQNFQTLQLKIQQIKKNLQRKADAQGTKKGFSFLQNKITQLYLFLTEPDTEDAMIVRKGFNCLSCSKRVQKLRGRIGPKLNWNNMTSTNYSPPRVGYSKPMGQSGDKQEDI